MTNLKGFGGGGVREKRRESDKGLRDSQRQLKVTSFFFDEGFYKFSERSQTIISLIDRIVWL